MNAQTLIIEARKWIDVPFRHQGRSRLGVDCVGLLEVLLSTSGSLPVGYQAPTDYARRPDGTLLKIVARYCQATLQDPSRVPGCLVLIRWPKNPEPSHVALCTGPTIIHAYQRVGRVVENGYRAHWTRDTHSAWLLPGVSYV